MSKNEKKKKNLNEIKEDPPIDVVKNQIMESYQNGVVEDQLENNRAIQTFNNQKNWIKKEGTKYSMNLLKTGKVVF